MNSLDFFEKIDLHLGLKELPTEIYKDLVNHIMSLQKARRLGRDHKRGGNITDGVNPYQAHTEQHYYYQVGWNTPRDLHKLLDLAVVRLSSAMNDIAEMTDNDKFLDGSASYQATLNLLEEIKAAKALK